MRIAQRLLEQVPAGWRVTDVHVGQKWILVLVTDENGDVRAGVATAPRDVDPARRFQIGSHSVNLDARGAAALLTEPDASQTGVALATINALSAPPELSDADAADWLTEQCTGKSIAIIGRFPFIDDEIRPFASTTYVFEQQPQAGEFGADDMARILPQAEIVAITGSTVANGSIDGILAHCTPENTLVMLGPSTPLTPAMFGAGFDALFGVRVGDMDAVQASVSAGAGFQKINGLVRVSAFKANG